MHIEYLYYFRDFSRNLSISKTAAQYYMTPQGISRAIHQLEKDFGVKLTSYQSNEISLTPAGVELRDRLDGFLDGFESVKGSLMGYRLAELGAVSGSGRKSVSIQVTPCVSMYVSPLLDLQKPGLFDFDIRIIESELNNIAPSIASAEDEEAFFITSIPATEKYRELIEELCREQNLVYERLFTSPLVMLTSMFSPLAKKKSITPEEVRGHPVARYQDTVLGDALDDFILADSVKTISNATSVLNAQILQGHAIAFAPKLVEVGGAFLPDKVTTVPTEGFFDTEFGLLLHGFPSQSNNVREAVAYLHAKLEREDAGGRFSGTFTLA